MQVMVNITTEKGIRKVNNLLKKGFRVLYPVGNDVILLELYTNSARSQFGISPTLGVYNG